MMTSKELERTPAGKQWKTIGTHHHHGVNIPIFSLHSKNSCGIGEYPDLLPLIPWCRKIGFDTIQTLPLNDTGPNSSPYSALSAFALNPIYLGLARLPYLDELPELTPLIKELQKLTNTQKIDYPKLFPLRERFLQAYEKRVGQKIKLTKEYQNFIKDNPWLEGYALFKTLKIQHQWHRWEDWAPSFQDPTSKQVQEFKETFRKDIEHHYLVQYLCYQQVKTLKQAADEAQIFLKGDIPILLSRESADVWQHRNLFLTDYSAGAPPDQFSAEGQDWGSPIYNWEQMEKDNFQWWKDRLQFASHFYHLYRLDHVVGFYRIWAFSTYHQEGEFIPSETALWIPHGEKILHAMLESCSMLPIGEDLGTIPSEVRDSLEKLGICGTKVIRWERDWFGDLHFFDPKKYPLASMTTVSTHDCEPLTLWWQEHEDEAKTYSDFKRWPWGEPLSKECHLEILQDSHHSNSLFHINLLNEYLALVPNMTWPKLEDERINTPGIVSSNNWSYRFRPSVKEIIENDTLQRMLTSLARGRNTT